MHDIVAGRQRERRRRALVFLERTEGAALVRLHRIDAPVQAAGDLRQVGAVARGERKLRLRGGGRPLRVAAAPGSMPAAATAASDRAAAAAARCVSPGGARFLRRRTRRGMSAGGRMVGRLKSCARASPVMRQAPSKSRQPISDGPRGPLLVDPKPIGAVFRPESGRIQAKG